MKTVMAQDRLSNHLLSTLYAAPIQPELWNVFLRELSNQSGVSRAALISHLVVENDHRMLATLGDSMVESVPSYETHYYQFDEWTMRFPRTGVSERIVQGQEIWAEEAMRKSVFYNEFLTKYDVCETACIAAIGSTKVFEVLSIYRGPSEAPFDREQLGLLQMLVPHLQTALATRRKLLALQCRIADLENAFDQLKTALVLVNLNGRPVLVNRAARSICDKRDGLLLLPSGITAQRASENIQLRAAILLAIQAGTGKGSAHCGGVLISRSEGHPLQILAAPLTSWETNVPRDAVAVIFISDPDQKSSSPPAILRQLYGLTQAETRLALTLLEGKSLGEAAELRHVAQETVRTQVKSIFQKTGTKRQGELVRLLTRFSDPRP